MSLFEKDLRKESVLAEFLDSKYKALGWDFERIQNKELQKLGVDILLHQGGVSKRIDEKAQLHYLNKDLPTFALEINYFIGETLKQGWLFDPAKLTDIYAFVFSIHLKDGLENLTKTTDIISCEVIFVRRLMLLNELAKSGLHLTSCEAQSEKIRASVEKAIEYTPGFKFYISRHLNEQPVTLVVRKSFLKKMGKLYIFRNE